MARARRRTVRNDGPEPVDVHVGKRLRLARHISGISQTELADSLGLSFQAVQKYETGDNRISASKLYVAARIVNQSVSYFFDDIENAPEAKPGNGFSNDEIALIHSYRRLPDEALRRQLAEMTKLIGTGAGVKAQRRRATPSKRR